MKNSLGCFLVNHVEKNCLQCHLFLFGWVTGCTDDGVEGLKILHVDSHQAYASIL